MSTNAPRRELPRLRMLAGLASICLLLAQAFIAGLESPASATESSSDPLQIASRYSTDFKGAKSKGVGFRMTDETSGHHVDIRLKGHPGIEGRSLGVGLAQQRHRLGPPSCRYR